MHICVLAIDDVFDTGLAVVLDTLATAAALAGGERVPFPVTVTVASVRRRVRTHLGFRVDAQPLRSARPDVVVVPALGPKSPDAIDAALERRDVYDTFDALRTYASDGSIVAAACTGTFILGGAGLLDGHTATTTWWLGPHFRKRFPDATLDDTRMLVVSDRIVTAGAALAHVDLALWLVRKQSPTLASTVARHLLYDERPSQATYAMADHLAHDDAIVHKFERYARNHLATFTLAAAARATGASERTLERRLRAVLGRSPLAYVRDLRVERALHSLKTSDDTLQTIANAVGYEDAVTLRMLLREKTGRGVRELRRAFV
jgi:transcriptional regulator GlxA family with amidase domain